MNDADLFAIDMATFVALSPTSRRSL